MSTLSAVKQIEAEFAKLDDSTHPMSSINFIVSTIHRMIGGSDVSWDELKFTNDDIAKKVRLAKVRTSQENFKKMLNPFYPQSSLDFFTQSFHDMVESGETTWKELGFTAKDVDTRLQVKVS